MSGARWLATARRSHTRAMGSPQRFPLFGDGSETRRAMAAEPSIDSNGESLSGAALAEARYRDWYTARATGALDAVTPRAAPYTAPALTLTGEAPSATQTRLVIPPARARADAAARLAEGERIICGLADEFADIFPDELAAAVRFLSEGR
jgi:hypothetical protein